MTTIERLRMVLQSAMDDWDIHIEACPECLAEAMHMCIDGRIIMDRVEVTRHRMAKLEALPPGDEHSGEVPEALRAHLPRLTARAR